MEAGFSLRDSTVGIIGLGLMGGSLAMSLKGKCARLIGFDTHQPTLELALSRKIIDQASVFSPLPAGEGLGAALSRSKQVRADLLILATPVPSILDLLSELPSLLSQPCIVMDLGSTKRDILQAMSTLPENFDPIGGHPICGREKLGLENADAGLYEGAPFIITPLGRTSSRAKTAIGQVIAAIGAKPIEMPAEEHDRILASTSHLPYLISSALAGSTPLEYAALTGPGFRSTTRLAGTPPYMMMGILQSNREHVLEAIRSFRDSLDEVESALREEDYPRLEGILDNSRNSHATLVEHKVIETIHPFSC